MNATPKTTGKVAVLIPHYNDIAGLNLALASLADQSVAVIVIDDGSATAPQEQALRELHPYLARLNIIYLAENIGTAQALNVGLSYASEYGYIARLDCGDRSLSGRIASQKAFLDEHPQCHLVGCWAEHIDAASGKRYVTRYPSDHQDILAQMHRQNAFCDSATMYRRETALSLGGYPTSYKSAEDYALFFSIAKKYQTANIPEVLTHCHKTYDTISARHRLALIRILLRNIDFQNIGLALHGITRVCAQQIFHPDTTDTFRSVTYAPKDIGKQNRIDIFPSKAH